MNNPPTAKQIEAAIALFRENGTVTEAMEYAAISHAELSRRVAEGKAIVISTDFVRYSQQQLIMANDLLKRGLKYYADDQNWEDQVDENGEYHPAPVKKDRGLNAKKALDYSEMKRMDK